MGHLKKKNYVEKMKKTDNLLVLHLSHSISLKLIKKQVLLFLNVALNSRRHIKQHILYVKD